MRILLLGGTGFIGRHVARFLAEDGHAVAVFHRGLAETEGPASVERIRGERDALAESREDFAHFGAEVVIDAICYTEAQAREAVTVFGGAGVRAVVLSSSDVYRNYDGLRSRSTHPPDPAPLSEEAPLREHLYPYRDYEGLDFAHARDYDKILVERAYRGAPSLRAAVLRLPAVYGPGDGQRRLWSYLRRMDDGRRAVLLEEAQAGWRWTRGYVENVAAAVAHAATDERAAGRIYNVGEARAATEMEWVRRIGRAARWHGEVVALPHAEMPETLRTSFDYRYGLATDTRRLRRELGFADPVTPEEAMQRALAWTRAHPLKEDAPPDYAAEDAALRRQAEGG